MTDEVTKFPMGRGREKRCFEVLVCYKYPLHQQRSAKYFEEISQLCKRPPLRRTELAQVNGAGQSHRPNHDQEPKRSAAQVLRGSAAGLTSSPIASVDDGERCGARPWATTAPSVESCPLKCPLPFPSSPLSFRPVRLRDGRQGRGT
jgi:hypothetical protein